jgi:hypothetical protein
MTASIATRAEQDALLAAHQLKSWPTTLTPKEAVSFDRPEHVSVEATYREGHFEEANFEGLRLEAGDIDLPEGARYRVDGVLLPGLRPDPNSVGYARLLPFLIEALTRGRAAEHPSLRVQAYRSLGCSKASGYGDYPEPRISKLEVFTGQNNGAVYVAVVRALCRHREVSWVYEPCRSAWRGLFPEGSSVFRIFGAFDPEPEPPSKELPSDPTEGVLAVRERLRQAIHKPPNQLAVDGVIMAFARGTMACLRMGAHRVLHRTSAALSTLLWEHTLLRYPPPGDLSSEILEPCRNVILSVLAPGSTPSPVHSAPADVGDRWLIFSGHLLDHVADEAVTGALAQQSPDEMTAWLEAEAARFPQESNPEPFPDWGLVVVDVAPRAAGP